MASNKLIIDDDYCKSVKDYCNNQGEQLNGIIEEYISIMRHVRSNAIVSGEVAEELNAFLDYAQQLSGVFKNLSSSVSTQINGFVSKVDAADTFKF